MSSAAKPAAKGAEKKPEKKAEKTEKKADDKGGDAKKKAADKPAAAAPAAAPAADKKAKAADKPAAAPADGKKEKKPASPTGASAAAAKSKDGKEKKKDDKPKKKDGTSPPSTGSSPAPPPMSSPISPTATKKPPSRPSSALKRPPSASGKPSGGSGALRKSDLKDIQSAIDAVIGEGRIPLVLDASGKVDTFYSYNHAHFIEAKNLFLRKFHQTIPFDDLMEECRKKLVTAMKHGHPFIISLTDSATDFLKTFNSDSAFPIDKIFQLAELQKEVNFTKILKPEDKDGGAFVVHKDFKVIVTSFFYPEDYEFFLAKSIPIKYCSPIFVTGTTAEVKD